MALSYVQYQGDGTQQTFSVPFPYIDKTHVRVRVALDARPFTWDDPQTIRISPAPAPGAVVEIRRETPRDNRLVDFVDGSVLTEADLDLAVMQTFYITQEAVDIAGGTLELLSDGSYGAGGRRIKSVGIPIEPRDAVTKEYHDGSWIPQMQALVDQARSFRDLTEADKSATSSFKETVIAARDAALQYRDAALIARDDANQARTDALVFKEQASQFKNNAASSATTAGTHRTAAEAAQAASESARTTATQKATAAAESAAAAAASAANARQSELNAATFDPSQYYKKTDVNSLFSNYYDKTTVTASLNAKADASNPTFTGTINLNGSSGNKIATSGDIYGTAWNGWLSTYIDTRANAKASAYADGLVQRDGAYILGFDSYDLTKAYLKRTDGNYRRLITSQDNSVNTITRQAGYFDFNTTAGAMGVTYFVSDERYKENIQQSSFNASSLVQRINFITYDWREDAPDIGHVPCGVSAQDLQKLHPRLVKELSDGTLMVNDPQLVSFLGKALQECLTRLDALERALKA